MWSKMIEERELESVKNFMLTKGPEYPYGQWLIEGPFKTDFGHWYWLQINDGFLPDDFLINFGLHKLDNVEI